VKGKDYIDKSMWSFFIYMDKLTLKQRSWIKEYIETQNATEAAMRVYDCKDRDSANTIGGENLVKLGGFLDVITDEMGLNVPFLLDLVKQGCLAEKVISANIIQIKSDDPTVTDKEAHAKTMDFIDVPDWANRKAFIEIALKLKKFLTTGNKIEINNTVEFAIDVNLNEKFNKHQSLISERFGIPLS